MLVTPEEGWIDRITVISSTNDPAPVKLAPGGPGFRQVRDVDFLNLGDRVPNYPFTNELGQAVRLHDFAGQAVVLNFIFTRCPFPNYCPRLTGNLADVQQKLKARSDAPKNWRLLTITVDPDYDTPARLKAYGERFKYDPEHWSLLTGAQIELDALTEQLGFIYTRDPVTSFINSHNSRTVVLDTQGRVQHVDNQPDFNVEEVVRQLVRAAAVPAAPRSP
jgi:protein SCO1/2